MKKKELVLIGIGAILASAAAIILIQLSQKEGEEKPSKKAPQVPVDNPGDQSDFPNAASESEVG
jgi:hypothetical protein